VESSLELLIIFDRRQPENWTRQHSRFTSPLITRPMPTIPTFPTPPPPSLGILFPSVPLISPDSYASLTSLYGPRCHQT
jgi:hypothetical protein